MLPSGALEQYPDQSLIQWNICKPNTTSDLTGVAYGNGLFVATCYMDQCSDQNFILTSHDGIAWTSQLAGTDCRLYGVTLEERVAAGAHGINARKGAFAVLILSLLPGGGYMYLGLMNRGLQALIIFFGSIFLAAVAHLGVFTGLVIPVLMLYSIFDSQQLVTQMNTGLFIEDKPYVDTRSPDWQGILGYILVGLGIIALFYNFVPDAFIPDFVVRLAPSLCIIAVGAYILYRNLRRSAGRGNTDDSAKED